MDCLPGCRSSGPIAKTARPSPLRGLPSMPPVHSWPHLRWHKDLQNSNRSNGAIAAPLCSWYVLSMANGMIRGRGAQSAAVPQRFGLAEREIDGDWRDYVETLDGPPVKLRTSVVEEHPRTILTSNRSPDIGFDRSVNAYRGCEHGCIYCFARPTHAFHD